MNLALRFNKDSAEEHHQSAEGQQCCGDKLNVAFHISGIMVRIRCPVFAANSKSGAKMYTFLAFLQIFPKKVGKKSVRIAQEVIRFGLREAVLSVGVGQAATDPPALHQRPEPVFGNRLARTGIQHEMYLKGGEMFFVIHNRLYVLIRS